MKEPRIRVSMESNYKGIYLDGVTYRLPLDPSKPMAELKYPEFYDVKLTETCHGACKYCYMDSKPTDPHASDICKKTLEYFGSLSLNQRPFQVALGGGEPTLHPEFCDVLKTFHDLGITPNYTTNGMFIENWGKAQDIFAATLKYCGGVAISCHPHLDEYWRFAATRFADLSTRLNFHIIISDRDSIDRFVKIYNAFKDVVDYFVLLPYGIQGRAVPKEIDYEYLIKVSPTNTSKIAFGANFHQMLTSNPGNFKVSLYEPEMFSKFLDYKDMKLYPSSFNLQEIVL